MPDVLETGHKWMNPRWTILELEPNEVAGRSAGGDNYYFASKSLSLWSGRLAFKDFHQALDLAAQSLLLQNVKKSNNHRQVLHTNIRVHGDLGCRPRADIRAGQTSQCPFSEVWAEVTLKLETWWDFCEHPRDRLLIWRSARCWRQHCYTGGALHY